MKDRLALVDMLNLADLIMGLPLQIEIEIGSAKYLLAHAMTFDSAHGVQKEALYLEGLEEMQLGAYQLCGQFHRHGLL